MNAWFDLAAPAWRLAGWTMLHFLWAGTLVALVGAAVRAACRRAAPGVRYGTSLVTLVMLAALPVGIGAWLSSQPEFAATPLVDSAAATSEIASRRDAATWGSFSETAKFESPSDSTTVVDLAEADATLQPPALPGGSDAEELTAGGAVGDGALFAGATPGQSPGLTGANVIFEHVVAWLPVVWLVGAPLTFALLAAGLVGSRRLRSGAAAIVDGPVFEACRRLEKSLGIARQVALATCDRLAQPVLVGILRPTILLPASVLTGWSAEELEMVLLHELAHVRRWDNLVNLAQRIIESLLFFHPCVWLASRQVRRDREECCDALVVRHTARPEEYAELLIRVASRVPRRALTTLAASCTLADHPLASRVRRILKLEEERMHVSRRTLGLMVALSLVLSVAVYRAAFAMPAPVATDGAADAKPQAAEASPQTEEGLENGGAIYSITFSAEEYEIRGREWLKLISNLPEGAKISFDERSQRFTLTGPEELRDRVTAFFDAAQAASPPASADVQMLKADIARFHAQLDLADKELADIEVLKEVAIQQAQSPSALDAAVQAELDKDPAIAGYRQQLDALNLQIQAIRAAVKEDDPRLKDLQASSKKIDEALERYRAQAEREARDRLAKIPNEALRAAMVEYKVRQKYITEKKAEIEAKLKEAETRMTELTAGRADTTGESEGAKDGSEAKDEVAEIRAQIARIEKEIADNEVLKEVSLQHGWPGAGRLDAAVQAEMDKDPTIGNYKQQLSELRSQIEKLPAPGSAQLRRLQSAYAQIEDAMNHYRAKAERDARERLKPSPEDLRREATAEYDKRRKQLLEKRSTLQRKLSEAETSRTDIPSANTGAEGDAAEAGASQDPLMLRVAADGRIKIDGATVDLPDLRERLSKQPKSRQVRLTADAACPYRHVIAVIDACHQAGIPSVNVGGDGAPVGARDVAEGTGGTSPAARSGVGVATQRNTQFLYDGKTFDEWRELSKIELKVERRQEAIEALTAFARAGFGRDAAEAIFDVAGEYDFYTIDGSAEGKLKERVFELLTTANGAHVSEVDWLPALTARISADPRKWEWLAVGVLNRLETSDKGARAILEGLAGAPTEIGAAANKALAWLPNLVREMMKHDMGDGLVGFLEERELGSEEWNAIKLADTDGDNMLTESEILAAPSEALRRVSEWEKIHASDQGVLLYPNTR